MRCRLQQQQQQQQRAPALAVGRRPSRDALSMLLLQPMLAAADYMLL